MKRAILILLLAIQANAQSLNVLYKESIAAAEQNDYPKFLELSLTLDGMRPMHPGISYSLATAYALNNDNASSFAILRRIALMDSRTDIAADENFAAFRETNFYADFQALRRKQEEAVANSQKAATLSEKMLHPEGLIKLSEGQWLAASVRQRRIVAFDAKTGFVSNWLSGNDVAAVFAIKSDKDGKYLWAATGTIPEMENYGASAGPLAELIKIDIARKEIVKRYPLKGEHIFGDLYVAYNGKVYISDSGTPVIYTIENDNLTEWLNLSGNAFSLQGITMDEKAGILYVADYLKGILAVSVIDKSHRWLGFPEDASRKGIDGITFYNNTLIAVQNGVFPIRIMQYSLDKTGAISGHRVIDNNRPEFNEPVLGTVYDNKFWFFANSPWKAYSKDGIPDEGKVGNPELYYFPLNQ